MNTITEHPESKQVLKKQPLNESCFTVTKKLNASINNSLFDSEQQMVDDQILDPVTSVDSNIVLSGSSTHSSSSSQGSLHNSVFVCINLNDMDSFR